MTIRNELNQLSEKLCRCTGFTVPAGFDFFSSDNPRAQQVYRMAEIAWEHFKGDSPDHAEDYAEKEEENAEVAESKPYKKPKYVAHMEKYSSATDKFEQDYWLFKAGLAKGVITKQFTSVCGKGVGSIMLSQGQRETILRLISESNSKFQ
ncbi:MAG: hypothetical protein WBB28_01215 [Crinalium sp.]